MKWISALDLTKTNFDVKYFLSETLRASSIKSYNIFALFFFFSQILLFLFKMGIYIVFTVILWSSDIDMFSRKVPRKSRYRSKR